MRTPARYQWAHAHALAHAPGARGGGGGSGVGDIYLESYRVVARMPHVASPPGATVPLHGQRQPPAVLGAASGALAG